MIFRFQGVCIFRSERGDWVSFQIGAPETRPVVEGGEIGQMQKRQILQELNDALHAASLKTAEFSEINPTDNLPKNEREVTGFIRRRVKLHHDTWIIGPITRAIKLIEAGK